jgi:hypothetical protein
MHTHKINECTRCNGTGYIGKWKHILKGICFECEGEEGYARSSYRKDDRVVKNKEKYHKRIKALIMSEGTVLSGRVDLLYNSKILDSMASLAEEGFDDEILADFAHQMSKR